jgi:thiamine-phosphate pyrophosphorylase
MTHLAQARLYGILDFGYVTQERAATVLKQMLDGGVDIVQLRAKNKTEADIRRLAEKLHPIAHDAGVPFIINDFPQLAAFNIAEGAHVGQDDISVAEARHRAGSGKIVGKSTHSVAQAVAAVEEGPDYIGFGPLFSTPTKPDYVPIGLEDIRKVHELVSIPIFCIGGIKLENLDPVLDAGARRVVIVSGILQASDISGYCQKVRAKLEGR